MGDINVAALYRQGASGGGGDEGFQVGDFKPSARYHGLGDNWHRADGSRLIVADYPDLAATLGSTFDGGEVYDRTEFIVGETGIDLNPDKGDAYGPAFSGNNLMTGAKYLPFMAFGNNYQNQMALLGGIDPTNFEVASTYSVLTPPNSNNNYPQNHMSYCHLDTRYTAFFYTSTTAAWDNSTDGNATRILAIFDTVTGDTVATKYLSVYERRNGYVVPFYFDQKSNWMYFSVTTDSDDVYDTGTYSTLHILRFNTETEELEEMFGAPECDSTLYLMFSYYYNTTYYMRPSYNLTIRMIPLSNDSFYILSASYCFKITRNDFEDWVIDDYWAWGSNNYNQVGDGVRSTIYDPATGRISEIWRRKSDNDDYKIVYDLPNKTLISEVEVTSGYTNYAGGEGSSKPAQYSGVVEFGGRYTLLDSGNNTHFVPIHDGDTDGDWVDWMDTYASSSIYWDPEDCRSAAAYCIQGDIDRCNTAVAHRSAAYNNHDLPAHMPYYLLQRSDGALKVFSGFTYVPATGVLTFDFLTMPATGGGAYVSSSAQVSLAGRGVSFYDNDVDTFSDNGSNPNQEYWTRHTIYMGAEDGRELIIIPCTGPHNKTDNYDFLMFRSSDGGVTWDEGEFIFNRDIVTSYNDLRYGNLIFNPIDGRITHVSGTNGEPETLTTYSVDNTRPQDEKYFTNVTVAETNYSGARVTLPTSPDNIIKVK